MADNRNITGVILAGGGARRMFPDSAAGGDKARVALAGLPMIAHVTARMRPQVTKLLINANGEAERFYDLGLPVVMDVIRDQGPLAGILAAMDWALRTAPSCTAIVSVSTDTPFLPGDLVARLAAASGNRPAIAASLGRVHPVIGLWPLSLREALETSLKEERRSVEKFAIRHEAIAVPFALRTIGARTVDPFFNANTPEDLAFAEALLSDSPTPTSG